MTGVSLIDRSSARCCQLPSLPKWGNPIPPKRGTHHRASPAAGKSQLPAVRKEPPGHIQGVSPHSQCEAKWFGPVWIHLYRCVDIECVRSVFMMMREKWRIIPSVFLGSIKLHIYANVYLKQLYFHASNCLFYWNNIFNLAKDRGFYQSADIILKSQKYILHLNEKCTYCYIQSWS